MYDTIRSFFTTAPKRPTSQLGAGSSAEDDPVMPQFQQAWKEGATFDDLFGPSPFTLHGSVGRSGADNHRPDVAKVETFLGDAGYYKPLTNDGPSGWHSTNLDQAIRSFQKDNGLEVDGFLKPKGPTISKIGSLLGGANFAAEPQPAPKPEGRDPYEQVIGGRDPGDPDKLKPPAWWKTIGQEDDGEEDSPWPTAPQPEGVPVAMAAQARVAPSGFMPNIRPNTPEEQAKYQQEYQAWLKENLPKIQQNQILEAQGYPPMLIPDPPLAPGHERPDPTHDFPIRRPAPRPPVSTPQPHPAPQPAPAPEIVFGPGGGPTIRLPMPGGGTGSGPANPFPMPQPPRDVWEILAGRKPKPKDPFAGHTISEDGAREHDSYAASLVRDSNPDETARTLKNIIGWYGDQGRGDVADLLGRFAKHDEAKAKALQDALHRASGERIPFRVAPLGAGMAAEAAGEEDVKLPTRNPFGSAEGADRWEAGNMAKALLGKTAYDDAVTHFAGEFKRDPGAARAYTAAIYQDMAAASPKQAVEFAQAMGKAGLAEEPKKPEGEPAPVQVADAGGGTATDAPPAPQPNPPVTAPPAPPAPTEAPQTTPPKPPETKPGSAGGQVLSLPIPPNSKPGPVPPANPGERDITHDPRNPDGPLKPKPDLHPTVTLEFDGKEFKAIEDGKVVKSWPAVAGRPGSQGAEHQGEKNKGPIPEGEWLLRQDRTQTIDKISAWNRLKGSVGGGTWGGLEDAWGKTRVWLEPEQGTDTTGRADFSVHGGRTPGSAGCIDLTDQMEDFADYFRRMGKDVKVRVNYSRNRQRP